MYIPQLEVLKNIFAATNYLETNLSILFFTNEYVYKIKKPLHLPFVDFTNPTIRQQMMQEEFYINKIISPDVHLKLIALRYTDDGFVKFADSSIKNYHDIEYAIKMNRLSENNHLPKILKNKKISPLLTENLALEMVNCHTKLAKVNTGTTIHKDITALKNNFLNNIANIEKSLTTKIMTLREFKHINFLAINVFEKYSLLLQKRLKLGKSQRIHGDLRSDNVFMRDNGTMAFIDSILPIDDWKFGDCAMDVAALAMDFDAHDLKKTSVYLVSLYAKIKQDQSLEEVIWIYKLYWALIVFWVNLFGYTSRNCDIAKSKAKLYKNLILYFLENSNTRTYNA